MDAIISASVDKSDDIIQLIAEKEEVKCFRGSMLNKLRRWYDCCDHFNIEKFHTVDADDSFFDGELIKKSFIRNRYKCNVGYSGHEVGLAVSYAAAALGITSLERQITLGRAMYGSDQAASVALAEFRQLVGAVRKIEKAMGNGNMAMNSKEIPITKKLRAHIPFESHKWRRS